MPIAWDPDAKLYASWNHDAGTHTEPDVKPSILQQIRDWAAAQKVQTGQKPALVYLTPLQMQVLKLELGSKSSAQVCNIDDVSIQEHSVNSGLVLLPFLPGPTPSVELKPAKTAKAPMPTKVYHKSISDEHGTPNALVSAVAKKFKIDAFDLDPCATADSAKAPVYFDQEMNGLQQDWFGTVWLNPPYTKGQVAVWILKLLKEIACGRVDRAALLVAARPDTQWWHAAVSWSYEVSFLKGRLIFQGNTNPAPFPSAILLFDPKQTEQRTIYWDWEHGVTVSYLYGKGLITQIAYAAKLGALKKGAVKTLKTLSEPL